MTAAPRIETERLVLRPHVLDDFPHMVAFFASEAARYVGGPMEAPRCWHGFASDVGSWELLGFGGWGVEEKATGAFAGQVGLNRPAHFPEREIGWISDAGPRGQRLRDRGGAGGRAYAYGTLGWTTAVSYVDPQNVRSIALARRLGCTVDPGAQSRPSRRSRLPPSPLRRPAHDPDRRRPPRRAAPARPSRLRSIGSTPSWSSPWGALQAHPGRGRLKAEHGLPPSDPAREARRSPASNALPKKPTSIRPSPASS